MKVALGPMNVKIFSYCPFFALAAGLLLSPLSATAGINETEPLHHGVASCAGSTCHGATQAFAGRAIGQGEYFIWQRRDRHAQAYNTLLSPRSQALSAKLGWGKAERAAGCLSCHSDNVAAPQRGERFLLSDGVGCEACHGASGGWLESHTQGYKTLAARSTAGLYATWAPQARAQLCLSCHQDNAERRMTHRMMAAGHPVLLFELDTFTQLQPPHFDADADYALRKPAPDAAANWLAGQLQSADLFLHSLAAPAAPGVFPELVLFECNACHRAMNPSRAAAARNGGQAAGAVPLADTPLLMLAHWLQAGADASRAERWRTAWRSLHLAVAAGNAVQLRQRALGAQTLLREELLPLSQLAQDAAQLRRLLDLLCSETLHDLDGSFAHAEQTAMAASVLMTALGERKSLSVSPEARVALDRLYASVRDRDRYAPEQFRAALNALRASLR